MDDMSEETEICVCCKKDTKIPKRLHCEDSRRNDNGNPSVGSHYVETSGQLCDGCWDSIYMS